MARPVREMSFTVEVFTDDDWAREVATRIEASLPRSGTVVITGGTTAAGVYRVLEDTARWNDLDVLFSDERCVPPGHPDSNFKMATELFLNGSSARVHRMPGELDPLEGARRYHDDIAELVAAGIDFGFMGMGADCHVGALYPASTALEDPNYCAAVGRPDGMNGLTLTPSAMLACAQVRLIVTGAAKADAVTRVLSGKEDPSTCPAMVLAGHPDAVLWLDEAAAQHLA